MEAARKWIASWALTLAIWADFDVVVLFVEKASRLTRGDDRE